MPDYSMCSDLECPSRMQCLRFTAVVRQDGWQSYGTYDHKDQDKCDDFMGREKSETKKRKKL